MQFILVGSRVGRVLLRTGRQHRGDLLDLGVEAVEPVEMSGDEAVWIGPVFWWQVRQIKIGQQVGSPAESLRLEPGGGETAAGSR